MPALLRARTNEQARQALKTVTIPPSLTASGPDGRTGGLMRLCGYKDVQTKLHPCLVESSPAVIQDPDRHDMLDLVTAARLYITLIDACDGAGREEKKDRDHSEVKNYDMPASRKIWEL